MTAEGNTYRFLAEANPSEGRCGQIVALAPENPFYTFSFVATRRVAGAQPWVFSLSDKNGLVTACTGFMMSGRFNRQLEIQSLPRLPPDDTFWCELKQFCTINKVTELAINSFGSTAASIPVLGIELWRKPRTEYSLDLTKPDLWGRLSSNHKRNIKRAKKANIVVRQANDFSACQTHAHLISSSMIRRRTRGEDVTVETQAPHFATFIEHRVGVLFQAVLSDTVVSSMLVLNSTTAGYYHSAGTSTVGMKHGGSYLLVYEIAQILRNQGMTRFNLGGADSDQAGLIRFKVGFGATDIPLEAAGFYLGGRMKRILTSIVRTFR